MKNYKVKMVILDENDLPKISSIISLEAIKDIKKFHNICALDEQLNVLLKQIGKNS